MNITRYFLASARRISNQCTNQHEVMEAMKQTVKTSLEYKRSIHVKNLYRNLKNEGIGTMKIERMSRRICDTLPHHRHRTLVKLVTQWKLQDAYKELRIQKSRNMETWRRKKGVIAAAGVLNEYERLWTREVTKY